MNVRLAAPTVPVALELAGIELTAPVSDVALDARPDLRAALQKQNMQEADIKEGDAVFFNTGFGKLWIKNNDKFNSGEPGIGLEVAKWCIDKGVCMTGADTWATEVVPNPNKDLAFPVHQELIPKNGIYNHENLDFTGLIADRKYQFAYIFSPAPIKGATGSNGGPIAVT